MPDALRTSRELANAHDDKRTIRAGALDDATLKDGQEVTVWSKEVSDDKVAWWGAGPENRDRAISFVDLALEASGNGSGTDGNAIEDGELVLAITDNDQRRVLASTTAFDLTELSDATSENRSEKPVLEAMKPFARPGRVLEIRIRAGSDVDGYEIDSADSSGTLYYSEAMA